MSQVTRVEILHFIFALLLTSTSYAKNEVVLGATLWGHGGLESIQIPIDISDTPMVDGRPDIKEFKAPCGIHGFDSRVSYFHSGLSFSAKDSKTWTLSASRIESTNINCDIVSVFQFNKGLYPLKIYRKSISKNEYVSEIIYGRLPNSIVSGLGLKRTKGFQCSFYGVSNSGYCGPGNLGMNVYPTPVIARNLGKTYSLKHSFYLNSISYPGNPETYPGARNVEFRMENRAPSINLPPVSLQMTVKNSEGLVLASPLEYLDENDTYAVLYFEMGRTQACDAWIEYARCTVDLK